MIAEKAVVIGWDAPIVKSVKKYVKEGKMPNTKRLIETGVWGENCLVPHPTITPPNWTTIVTGARIGTHGIICFNLLEPKSLEKSYQAFFKDDCLAEYIWEPAGKIGKKTILFNYPSTWPEAVKNGIQIGGAGLGINEYRTESRFGRQPYSISGDLLFTTEELPQATAVKIVQAKSWKNLPEGKAFKESEIAITFRLSSEICKEKPWHLLLINSGKKFDKVGIYRKKDGKEPLVIVEKGKWSENIYEEIATEKGKKKVVFKVKLIDISSDGNFIKLYFSPLCNLEGWAFPKSIEKELGKIDGLPTPNSFYASRSLGWIDFETLSDLIDFQNIWYGEAVNYLLKNKEWSLFFMHAHCPDHFYHSFMNALEPGVNKDETLRKAAEKAESNFYASLDRMIGKILEAVDEEKTMVIITSDHGATPTENLDKTGYKPFNVNDIFKEKGFFVTVKDHTTGREKIDWKKTKAVAALSCYIYINLKGKYPHGTVEKKDYEKLQEEIIKVLYDYTDPISGKKPIAFAFKKEDARIIGLYGDRIGDIVYGIFPEVSGEHGRQITTGEYGVGSMKGLFIAKGPGVKKGKVLERTIWLTDITPTICYALDLPVPEDCEGAVVYQLFEDPDFKRKEIEKLKKHYEGMKKALEGEKFLTHTY